MGRRDNEARVQWRSTKAGFTNVYNVYVQIITVATEAYKYVFSMMSGLSAVRKHIYRL
jgi:hypothetical protein